MSPKTRKKSSQWRTRVIKKPPTTKSIFIKRALVPDRRKKIKKGWIKKFSLVLFLLILLGGVLISVGLAWLTYSLPQPEKLLQRNVAQSTKIYDRAGQTVLYEIFAEQRRTLVKLEDIPQYLIQATLVAEDKEFFTHPGFDLKAIIRSILVDIIQGGKVQGGSTLTQQFIKNAFLTQQKTYQRKIKELILAYRIEKKYSKPEILQMYFNEIPYGSNAYGAEAASQIYFSKSVKNLTLDEAALLAALVKAPSYYSPYGDYREELVARKNYILKTMAEENYITQEIALQAENTDTLKKITPRRENIVAPHFVMYVKSLLTEKYGQRLVEQGGLKVITSLDINKQKIAEQTIEKYAANNEKNFKATNAALVSLDVASGQILAMVGSKDFFDDSIDGQVNIATRPRQPGSSFKPIVYAAAFEKGYTPDTILFDVETAFGPVSSEPGAKDYIPKNYDEKCHGPVTMRQSLAGSLNIPGVKTLYLAGLSNVLNLAKKMGYTTLSDPSHYGLSLVLGGGEIKLLEHVAAFSVFAREGKKIPLVSILKVQDNEGNILEENDLTPLTAEKIFEPQISRLINDILSDNQSRSFVFGENNFLTLPDRPVAAKTGTTNDFRDAWTIGYTPDLATGVWVGNSRNEAMDNRADGSTVAAPIWQEFMKQCLINTPPKKFNSPEPVTTNKPILNGEIPQEEISLKIDKASGKLATDLTPSAFIIEKTFKKYYPILYYVDKNNPLGPAPENPEADPQYAAWEKGIKDWLTPPDEKTKNKKCFADLKEGSIFEMPPVEYDDLHVPANQPNLSILSPENAAVINENILKIDLQAAAPRGIKKIVCFLDNFPLDIAEEKPYQCSLNLAGVSIGEHKLKATAFDDIDNTKSQEIRITTTQFFKREFSWLNPQNNQTLFLADFPLTLSVLTPLWEIKTVKFFAQNEDSRQISLLGTVFNPEASGQIDFIWKTTNQGRYKLWAQTIDLYDQATNSPEIEIDIK